MSNRKLKYFVGASLIILMTSCGNSRENETFKSGIAAMEMAAPSADMETKAASEESQTTIPVPERKIIKDGNIRFRASDVNKTSAEISATTSALGGYISANEISDMGYRIQCNLEIRIPAEKFDSLLMSIAMKAVLVESQQVNVTDVTEEFIDVEARLQTKKSLEARYLDLLNKAYTVEDILKIESEIGVLREEIESVEGRLRYLKDRIAQSTLHVSFYVEKSPGTGSSSRFGDALKDGWSGLLSFIFGLFRIWPFILILAGGLFFLRRYLRKKRNQSHSRNN